MASSLASKVSGWRAMVKESGCVDRLVHVRHAPAVERANDDPVHSSLPAEVEEALELGPLPALVALLFVFEAHLGREEDAALLGPTQNVFPLVFQLLPGGAHPPVVGHSVIGAGAVGVEFHELTSPNLYH